MFLERFALSVALVYCFVVLFYVFSSLEVTFHNVVENQNVVFNTLLTACNY